MPCDRSSFLSRNIHERSLDTVISTLLEADSRRVQRACTYYPPVIQFLHQNKRETVVLDFREEAGRLSCYIRCIGSQVVVADGGTPIPSPCSASRGQPLPTPSLVLSERLAPPFSSYKLPYQHPTPLFAWPLFPWLRNARMYKLSLPPLLISSCTPFIHQYIFTGTIKPAIDRYTHRRESLIRPKTRKQINTDRQKGRTSRGVESSPTTSW